VKGARFPLRVEDVGVCHRPLPEAGGRGYGWDHRERQMWDNKRALGLLGTRFEWSEGGAVARGSPLETIGQRVDWEKEEDASKG